LRERLDFVLPDFTRLSWVGDAARRAWEPRLERIARAWSDVEWLSVLAGVRPCSLTRLAPEALIREAACWAAHGRGALPLQIEGASSLPYASTPRSPEPGQPILLCCAVGTPQFQVCFKQAWDARDDEAIGALLGYPRCCRHFFKRVWVEQQSVDTTW